MSQREEAFLDAVSDKVIRRHGEIYFRLDDIREALTQSYHHNLAVIGLEGFEVDGKQLQPRLDMIADYSRAECTEWNAYRQELLSAALRFVEWVHRNRGSKEIIICPVFIEQPPGVTLKD